MSLRFLSAALLLALAAPCIVVAQTPAQEATSIVHVTVVDVASGRKLPDQIVVLQGGPRSLLFNRSGLPLCAYLYFANHGRPAFSQ